MSLFNNQVILLINAINDSSLSDITYCPCLDHPCFAKLTEAITDEYGCEIIELDDYNTIIKNLNKFIAIDIYIDYNLYEILFRIRSYKYLEDIY